MARVDDFDAFYHATRRPLLQQTYALTGDAHRANGSVERAFALAWSQWRKVRRLEDPLSWVRNEAWRVAEGPLPPRRRRSLRRRRTGVLDARDAPATPGRDMQALARLPYDQRRALVLHHLAELPITRIAREMGIAESAAASLLIQAEQGWDGGGTPIPQALARIENEIGAVRLARAPSLRRAGERRHRQQTLVGVVTAAALLVGGGVLIVTDTPAGLERAGSGATPPEAAGPAAADATGPPTPPTTPEPFLLDRDALLTATEMTGLTSARAGWSVTSTTDGTTGDPIYAACQEDPFADPDGNQALLRRYDADGASEGLSAVQVIEESRNETQGARAFDTMQDWYARCAEEGVQLLSTKAVDGLGDEARAFSLREVGDPDTFRTVGLVRTGPITVAVIASTRGEEPVPAERVLDRAALSVTRVCLPVSGDCSSRPDASEVPPLPTNEHPGFLATYDLPALSNVTAPWVGTDPEASPDDPAATPCERANLRRAQQPRTRVFVLPTAKDLPRRFGISQTVGTFQSRADAREFMRRAYASADGCTDRELSASRPKSRPLPGEYDGRVWRFEFEVAENSSVSYRVGLVRAGDRVSLVSMSPTDAYDVTQRAFVSLVVRAGQRLAEAG